MLGGMALERLDAGQEGGGFELKWLVAVPMPLDQAESTQLIAFRPLDGGPESLAVIVGAPVTDCDVPVIVHRQDVMADLVGNLGPGLGPLRQAIARLAALGGGVLLYVAVAADKAAPTAAAMLRHLAVARPKFLMPVCSD